MFGGVESNTDQVSVEVTQSSSPEGPGYVELYVCPTVENLFLNDLFGPQSNPVSVSYSYDEATHPSESFSWPGPASAPMVLFKTL